MEDIFKSSSNRIPILYMLSPGSDPTAMIDEFSRMKKKPTVPEKVSMGEGQEKVGLEKVKNGFLTGSWVILQNCHLGLKFIGTLEPLLNNVDTVIDDGFRLWLTGEPHNKFPIGILQMAVKVTNEPPKGIRDGLFKTYTGLVTQDKLDKLDLDIWRMLTWNCCFMHSIVQERRKFGKIGFCVP